MGKRLDFSTQELAVLRDIVADDVDTSESLQAHMKAEGDHECLSLGGPWGEGVPMTGRMADAIEREEVGKRILQKLGGGETND
jgi:hypothetical protein